MASKKILPGKLLGLALDALEAGDVAILEGRPWVGALKGNAGATPPPLPKAGRLGSSNFGVVANVCEAVAALLDNPKWFRQDGGRQQEEHPRWSRAINWLFDFYRRQGPGGDLGFMLYEPLSTVYTEAHCVAAMIAFVLGVEAAGPWLERLLALGLLHRCPNGRIVSASTRAGKNPRHGALEGFVRLALQGRDGHGGQPSLIKRAFALKGGWRAPGWLLTSAVGFSMRIGVDRLVKADERLGVLLDSIRFASGSLIWTLHANGHVSRWGTGPLCYASPLVAVAVRYQPWEVRMALYPGKTAAPFGEIAAAVADQAVWVTHPGNGMLRVLDIADLGPVVAEHRFEEVQRG